MQHSIFGTDGIRGRVGLEPITALSLVKIGYCFAKEMFGDDKGVVIIGHDGRESSDMIIKNLSKGISAQGSEVKNSGLASTPSIAAYLNIKSIASLVGIQVTASHNSYKDNGMKFFNHTGFKISQTNESNINSLFHNLKSMNYQDVAIRESDISIKETYLEFIKNYISTKLPILHKNSKKLFVIFDCANGALSDYINADYVDQSRISNEIENNIYALQNTNNILSISAIFDNFEKVKLPSLISSLVKNDDQKIISSSSIRLNNKKLILESEEDVNDYIETYKKAILKEIRSEKC